MTSLAASSLHVDANGGAGDEIQNTAGVQPLSRLPRLGFLGIGWIGRHRLGAIAKSGAAEITGLSDFDFDAATAAASELSGVLAVESLNKLLQLELDGLVIATPTALHAENAVTALASGLAVFCQKPLGRTKAETERVIEAARRADRLLAVDMSYRYLRGVTKIKSLLDSQAIGELYALDFSFHNAYGPDKSWYYDPRLSGGGCVIDLGIHLVDMALWMLGSPRIESVSSRLFAQGSPVKKPDETLEDYAVARLDFETGATATLSCSWNLPAGRDAVIRASFFGTKGGLSIHNVGGSFYDFRCEQFTGTSRTILDQPPDEWGGRAAVGWVQQLSESRAYDPAIEQAKAVAAVVDRIYGRK
jgi:predicted dehydrogenase